MGKDLTALARPCPCILLLSTRQWLLLYALAMIVLKLSTRRRDSPASAPSAASEWASSQAFEALVCVSVAIWLDARHVLPRRASRGPASSRWTPQWQPVKKQPRLRPISQHELPARLTPPWHLEDWLRF